MLDRPDMKLPGFVDHPSDAHIFLHSLTSRDNLIPCHENLLFVV